MFFSSNEQGCDSRASLRLQQFFHFQPGNKYRMEIGGSALAEYFDELSDTATVAQQAYQELPKLRQEIHCPSHPIAFRTNLQLP